MSMWGNQQRPEREPPRRPETDTGWGSYQARPTSRLENGMWRNIRKDPASLLGNWSFSEHWPGPT